MIIREVGEFFTAYDNLSFRIDYCKEELYELEKSRRTDIEEEYLVLKERLLQLCEERSKLMSTVSLLPVKPYQEIWFDQKFVASEIVKIMDEITGKKHVYKEEYRYSLNERGHSGIVRTMIQTIVVEDEFMHGPYIDYEDLTEKDCPESKDFYKMVKNHELYIFPDLSNTYTFDVYKLSNQGRIGFEAYHDGSVGYSVIYDYRILNFLTTLICKALYLGRNLNENEIEKIRVKYVELLKNNYSFAYYEDSLYDIEDKKALKK